jgi:hypothetical protein
MGCQFQVVWWYSFTMVNTAQPVVTQIVTYDNIKKRWLILTPI